jgi:hypothetical protein
MSVVKPPQFNERYTIHRNAAGEPVQRTLGEMTAGEVLAAWQWLKAETDRLEYEAKQHREIDDIAAAVQRGDISLEASLAEVNAGVEAGERWLQASQTVSRFQHIVMAILLPHWNRHPNMGFGPVLRRHWPGGRAA